MDSSLVRGHKVHVDLLRLFAIFFVVYAHNRTAGGLDGDFWGRDFVNGFIHQIRQMAVPVFFMISGALLLPKDEELSKLFKRRILRFFAALLVFWGVYVLANALVCHEYTVKEVARIFKYAYSPSTSNSLVFKSGAMWFLYCYIAMLVLLPFMRAFVRGSSDKLFLYMIGLQVVVCAILPTCHMVVFGSWIQPEVAQYLPFFGTLHHPFGGGYCMFYMLVGYYVENRMQPTIRQFRALCLVSIAMLFAGAFFSVGIDGWRGAAVSTPYVSFIAIPLVSLYYGTKRAFEKVEIGARTRSILSCLGGAVFATMVLESLLSGLIARYLVPDVEGLSYFESLAVVGAIVVTGLCIGCICKRIPLLKAVL